MAYTKAIVAPLYGLLAKPYGTPNLSSGSGIAIAHDAAPNISVYPWVDGVGFGTKYANPGIAIPSNSSGVAFTPNANTIFISHALFPYASAYPWSASGFGTKYADPGTPLGFNATDIECRTLATSVNHHIGITDIGGGTSAVNVYNFSKTGAGWGTKFADPASVPIPPARGVDFSPDGLAICVGVDVTPFLFAYPWSDLGFGTKYADPATLPTGGGEHPRFSSSGFALAASQTASVGDPTGINAYGWTNGAGFGTKYANPLYPPGYPGGSSPSFGVNFTLQNTAIGLGSALGFGGLFIWRWSDSSGFGVRYFLNFPFANNAFAIAWNDSKTTLFCAHATASPFMFARPWNDSIGMGTAYSDPATPPPLTGNDVAVAI